MLKIKSIVTVFALGFLLSSCGEFTKVLNKGTSTEQYELATKLFEAEKYAKALQLFDKIVPDYRGKPQMERIQYMMAKSKFETKDYLESAYYFNRFARNYPKSSKNEEASYMAAMSYYEATPKSSLDQSDTDKAINAFQKFIDKHPNSDRIKQANVYVKELQYKLETKKYNIAYQYYHTSHYKAAIEAFDNFLSDNLGTSYKEDALFYKAKASYDLAINSVFSKKEQRLKDALIAIERLEFNFKDSKHKAEANKMSKKLNEELKILNQNNS